MASSLQGKTDPRVRPVSDEEAAVFPDNARPTDESPTVISKTHPSVEPVSSNQNKITDLARKSPSPEAIVESLRGKKLAHYELIEPIGVGGMAAVIRARDTQLDRFVALKILPPEMAQEPENIQRFHQEAKAAAKLDHENIARVFFCGEDQGLHFIAFEFVEGMNLRTLLEKRGRVPVPEAIRYILQIAAGLEHAATRGVVHRDVKPSNIIITPSGRAKLVDMGLARHMARRSDRDLTQSGVTLGTFDYISPEQALEPRDADVRSDIYSLGCTLYHMLTGLPPVPDGTPAKKLHHHQHIAPVDPREIDPMIPEELVMILGKMMAKNPKDRYQRPIHLVHHLMKIAQKVGAADDLPEGVLIVDAPLPTQPRSRPLLLIGLALMTLVAIVMLVGMLTEPGSNLPVLPNPEPNGYVQPSPRDKGFKNQGSVTGVTKAVITKEVNKAEDLQKLLNDDSPDITAYIEGEIDVKDLKGAGLTHFGFPEQRLTLASLDRDTFAPIHFRYQKGETTSGMITQEGEVTFRNIKFQIDYAGTPEVAVAAVTVRGARKVKFDRCIFAQTVQKISPQRTPLASILIDTPMDGTSAKPEVHLNECYFESSHPPGGQVAIAINGPATVKATNCAFRSHGAFFSFRDKCSLNDTEVELQNCIGFVETGPAFRFSKNASARINVQRSVFSRPGSGITSTEQPGLIFRAGNLPFHYEGTQNIYHHLLAMVEKKTSGDKVSELVGSAEAFEKLIGQNQGSDQNSIHIPLDDPANPLQHPNPLTSSGDDVFQLRPEYQRLKIGLETTWLGNNLLQVVGAKAVTPPLKIVVDADDDRKTAGVYRNVLQALSGAKDGDVIWIKHGEDRKVEVPPIEIKPGISVTLKPYNDDHRPILILDKDFKNKDSALFKIRNGTLKIEQMEILLDPAQDDFVVQSMVQMGESAQLIFSGCVLTLRAPDKVQLNVATFLDLDLMPKMESSFVGSARVEFRDCFIRGKGDLVSLRGCRRLHVDVKNSLIAIHGSLLDIEAANKSMPIGDGVTWRMERTSVFTAESLFAFHANNGKVLTETKADVEGCLLAALVNNAPAAFHEIDRVRSDELIKVFSWRGRQNYFANFEAADVREWKQKDADAKSEVGALTFPKFDDKALLHKLWDATPEWFRPLAVEQDRISGFGVPPDVEKKLLPPDSEE